MATSPAEPVDETWRGGYATAASRRRMQSACSWGNGVRWSQAVGSVGHWIRIYPHTLRTDEQVIFSSTQLAVAVVTFASTIMDPYLLTIRERLIL